MRSSTVRAAWLAVVSPFASALAQEEVVVYEAVTSNGLAVADVGSHTLVLACRPDDNSVFVIDTATNTVLERVPVGLTPIAVTWDPTTSRFFTANRIGDSVSAVELTEVAGQVQSRLIATRQVYDEPMDVAIGPGGRLHVVMGRNAILSQLDATTLQELNTYLMTEPFTAVDILPTGGLDLALQAASALRAPRRIVVDGQRVHVLDLKGDTGWDVNNGTFGGFKYDLATFDCSGAAPASGFLTGTLGSTNEAMVLGSDGNLYVVGGMARNDVTGNGNLEMMSSGFVESRLYVRSSAHTATTTAAERDLNLDAIGGTLAAGESISQPAGVALLESGGNVNKVFVSSFGTDRLLELTVNAGAPSTWASAVITVPAPALAETMNGPRDLEIVDTANGPRLYVLNELGGSVSVFDPTVAATASTELARVALAQVLTDDQQRGRRFLYDARLSGNGKVSCASCHIDGRTDSLSWHLGDATSPHEAGETIPYADDPLGPKPLNWLIDGVIEPNGELLEDPNTTGAFAFPKNKGRMVTQSLQGLVEHPVNDDAQFMFSTGVLHWRGDRMTLDSFNEAFVNLLGAPSVMGSPASGPDAKGLTTTEMELFRRYVFDIRYEPNADQPRDRVHSGAMDDLPTLGSGGMRGLQMFLSRPNSPFGPGGQPSAQGLGFAGRSCVQCHSLPGGTNGRLCLLGTILLDTGFGDDQAQKSAQLRGLTHREGVVEFLPVELHEVGPLTGVVPNPRGLPRTGESGMSHAGTEIEDLPFNINRFASLFFNAFYDFPNDTEELARLTDLVTFLRELDSGTAPVIGLVETFDNGAGVTASVDLMEAQAFEANCDVVVHVVDGSPPVLRGYYLDVLASSTAPVTPRYREATAGVGPLVTRATLLQNATAVFQAVPVGSGRRIADPAGTGDWAALTGPAASNVVLEAMRPATQWREVASVYKNWNRGTGPDDFQWLTVANQGGTWVNWPNGNPDPAFPRAQRQLQAGLLDDTGTPRFGLTVNANGEFHHEPPRRFRVSGDDIRQGARLLLLFSSDPVQPGPSSSNISYIEAPLFPALDQSTGELVWETAVEANALTTLALLHGSVYVPGVELVTLGGVPDGQTAIDPYALDPVARNWFAPLVVNANGAWSLPSWQRLTITDN